MKKAKLLFVAASRRACRGRALTAGAGVKRIEYRITT